MADADPTVPTSSDPSPTTQLRIIDTPERCQLTLHRLAQAFTTVEASEQRPARGTRGLVRVYAVVTF